MPRETLKPDGISKLIIWISSLILCTIQHSVDEATVMLVRQK